MAGKGVTAETGALRKGKGVFEDIVAGIFARAVRRPAKERKRGREGKEGKRMRIREERMRIRKGVGENLHL